MIIECVVNVSEGRDERVLAQLAAPLGPVLLDVHSDPDHHRSVFTLAGPADDVTEASKALATAAVELLSLSGHQGAHPRLGVLDVVPFVPYDPGRPPPTDLDGVVPRRDDFALWLGDTLGVPSFLYGPLAGGRTRTLPEIRRQAFAPLRPDAGPGAPHPSAGASAIGARGVLVAYNVWVSSVEVAEAVAPLVRSPRVRALGLAVGDRAQVSCNLVAPGDFGPDLLYDAVATEVRAAGGDVLGAELVGLLPGSVLAAVPPARWRELGLTEEMTVESPLTPDALGSVPYEAVTMSRRCRARARRSRRRSRSLIPPQMPNFSPLARAYSRQSSRTTQPRHTSFASRVDAPRSGKNRSGSTPMQFAWICQLRSWRP